MHIIVLLGVGYIALFFIPASIRDAKLFLGVWGLCVAGVSYAFVRHKAKDGVADPLAQMFDRGLLDVAMLACALALGAWLLRSLADSQNWSWYPHWVVLVLGSTGVPVALFARFTQ